MAQVREIDHHRQSDRRAASDRRGEAAESFSPERRESQRRHDPDRRGWAYGVVFDTDQSAAAIEAWLDQNCAGKWSLGSGSDEDGARASSLKVMFELERDKIKFQDEFTG